MLFRVCTRACVRVCARCVCVFLVSHSSESLPIRKWLGGRGGGKTQGDLRGDTSAPALVPPIPLHPCSASHICGSHVLGRGRVQQPSSSPLPAQVDPRHPCPRPHLPPPPLCPSPWELPETQPSALLWSASPQPMRRTDSDAASYPQDRIRGSRPVSASPSPKTQGKDPPRRALVSSLPDPQRKEHPDRTRTLPSGQGTSSPTPFCLRGSQHQDRPSDRTVCVPERAKPRLGLDKSRDLAGIS